MSEAVCVALIGGLATIIAAVIAAWLRNPEPPSDPSKDGGTGKRRKRNPSIQNTNSGLKAPPRRIEMQGQWIGDNEIWHFEGDVKIEGTNARGRLRWTFVKCDKPSAKSKSWLKRVGDSAYEELEGSLNIDFFTLHLHGYKVSDSTLLALGVDKTFSFTQDWKRFEGKTNAPRGRICLNGVLSGSASVHFN